MIVGGILPPEPLITGRSYYEGFLRRLQSDPEMRARSGMRALQTIKLYSPQLQTAPNTDFQSVPPHF
jgi:hypothetical protein